MKVMLMLKMLMSFLFMFFICQTLSRNSVRILFLRTSMYSGEVSFLVKKTAKQTQKPQQQPKPLKKKSIWENPTLWITIVRIRFLPQVFVLVCFLLKDCPNAAEGRMEHDFTEGDERKVSQTFFKFCKFYFSCHKWRAF